MDRVQADPRVIAVYLGTTEERTNDESAGDPRSQHVLR